MKYINPHEFYLETNGRIIDVDGAYGGQCWDLFAYFCQRYCGRTFGCIQTGYVIDLWNTFEHIGLDNYFDKITDRNALQDGDWLIWDKKVSSYCWITSKSHIAMFRKYNDTNDQQNIILTQNPGGSPNYVHQMLCDFHGFVGALRPKTNQPKANITKFEAEEIGQDYVKVAFETDKLVDFAMYSINGLEYVNLPLNNTIDNLKDDTKYSLSIKLRTAGINQWVTSEAIEFTTLKIEQEVEEEELEEGYIYNIDKENLIAKAIEFLFKLIKKIFKKD